MSHITQNCPHCKADVHINQGVAITALKCPSCGKMIGSTVHQPQKDNSLGLLEKEQPLPIPYPNRKSHPAEELIRFTSDEKKEPPLPIPYPDHDSHGEVHKAIKSKAIPTIVQPVLLSEEKSGVSKWWLIGGGIVLSLAFLISAIVIWSRFGPTNKLKIANIERVLTEDSRTKGVNPISARVYSMRAIDIDQCPSDFRDAYLDHIHAWEKMADVERDANALDAKKDPEWIFWKGLLTALADGDLRDIPREFLAADTQLQHNYVIARDQIKTTFLRVEKSANSYGAKLPK